MATRKSKMVPPVTRRGGWTTGFPVTQESIKAISMNGLLLYVVAVSDYRVKDFKEAVEALRTFSEDWSRQKRAKPRRAKPNPPIENVATAETVSGSVPGAAADNKESVS